MKIIYDKAFEYRENDNSKWNVFQVFPDVYGDDRGYFTEVMRSVGQFPYDAMELWFTTPNWIRQINRSSSKASTIRGCHAQSGVFCQGKFVEALTEKIYDIIIDARPDSKSFGVIASFELDPMKQNKLWVPRGFLHSFVVLPSAKENAIFQYFCDNVYNKQSEIGIAPMSVLPIYASMLNDTSEYQEFKSFFNDISKISLSEKDINGKDYSEWMNEVKTQFETTGKLWYK